MTYMNPEQKQPPKGFGKLPLTDLIIIALAVFVIFRVPWNNMNSFHYLLFFLLLLCIMLRMSNARKVRMNEIEKARRNAEAEMQTPLLPADEPSVTEPSADENANAEPSADETSVQKTETPPDQQSPQA